MKSIRIGVKRFEFIETAQPYPYISEKVQNPQPLNKDIVS